MRRLIEFIKQRQFIRQLRRQLRTGMDELIAAHPDLPDLLRFNTQHHYQFAHVALREACAENPGSFFAVMASQDRMKLVDAIWKHVCSYCDQDGEPGFSISDISVWISNLRNHPALVIQMPEPTAISEAYFVGIVLDWKSGNEPTGPETPFHYFTLEKGLNRVTLGRWDGHIHYNYGEGPPPTKEDFLHAISEILDQPNRWHAASILEPVVPRILLKSR